MNNCLLKKENENGEPGITLIETLLSELEPVVLDEQKFCVRFFHLNVDSLAQNNIQDNQSTNSGDSNPEKKLERQFNQEVRDIMGKLFDPLTGLLTNFVEHCVNCNPSYILFLLARLSRHVLSVQDTGSYIAVIFGTTVIIVKRRFQKFMDSEIDRLREFKMTKRGRVGILEGIQRFEDLGNDAEAAFKGCERRQEMDKYYPQLVQAIFTAIDTAANDPNSKAPPSIVLMQNYHQIWSVLSELKIPCLDVLRKEAKKRYQDALSEYCAVNMGSPMEKLNNFFEKIQYYLDQGMRPEEIGYQALFSKQELRKHIAHYPGKDIKKGLDNVYSKVEKHLGRESPLLQVVWHHMQDALIQQYKHFTQLIAQCYPNSNIQLEFTLHDLLNYFSDIAQQH